MNRITLFLLLTVGTFSSVPVASEQTNNQKVDQSRRFLGAKWAISPLIKRSRIPFKIDEVAQSGELVFDTNGDPLLLAEKKPIEILAQTNEMYYGIQLAGIFENESKIWGALGIAKMRMRSNINDYLSDGFFKQGYFLTLGNQANIIKGSHSKLVAAADFSLRKYDMREVICDFDEVGRINDEGGLYISSWGVSFIASQQLQTLESYAGIRCQHTKILGHGDGEVQPRELTNRYLLGIVMGINFSKLLIAPVNLEMRFFNENSISLSSGFTF